MGGKLRVMSNKSIENVIQPSTGHDSNQSTAEEAQSRPKQQ